MPSASSPTLLKELHGPRVDTVLTSGLPRKIQDVQAFLKLTHVIAVKVYSRRYSVISS